MAVRINLPTSSEDGSSGKELAFPNGVTTPGTQQSSQRAVDLTLPAMGSISSANHFTNGFSHPAASFPPAISSVSLLRCISTILPSVSICSAVSGSPRAVTPGDRRASLSRSCFR